MLLYYIFTEYACIYAYICTRISRIYFIYYYISNFLIRGFGGHCPIAVLLREINLSQLEFSSYSNSCMYYVTSDTWHIYKLTFVTNDNFLSIIICSNHECNSDIYEKEKVLQLLICHIEYIK